MFVLHHVTVPQSPLRTRFTFSSGSNFEACHQKSLVIFLFQVWMIVSGAETLRELHPNHYEESLKLQSHVTQSTRDQIRTDLHRTFPNNIYFR